MKDRLKKQREPWNMKKIKNGKLWVRRELWL